MRCQGKEVASDIPLTSPAIERLALEATFRDLGIAQLVGQILVEAIKKDMIQEILRDEVPPSMGTAPKTGPVCDRCGRAVRPRLWMGAARRARCAQRKSPAWAGLG
jgi:hypothetical protein